MPENLSVKKIEKGLIKSLNSIIDRPTKKQLDKCRVKAREIYGAFYNRSQEEILAVISSESQEIAWED